MNQISKKLIAETTGTFALVFVGTGAFAIDVTYGGLTNAGVALAFGLVVFAMVFLLAGISGAHINPAVTLGFAVSEGSFDKKLVIPYIAAQCVGAGIASLAVLLMFVEPAALGVTRPSGPIWVSFLLEFVLTFVLMSVIWLVGNGTRFWSAAGIGATVGGAALFFGPVCGASMNPARSLGPAVVTGDLRDLWIYLVAPPLGACLASVLRNRFRQRPESKTQDFHNSDGNV